MRARGSAFLPAAHQGTVIGNIPQDAQESAIRHLKDSRNTPDAQRRTIFQGEAQLMTNMGPLPISFDIDAATLAEAVAQYPEATKAGIERAMREIQEMRRQASSSIVLPPAGATLPPGGPLGGGGKIQLP